MERKIGDTFEYEGKKLIVEESKSGSCDGCFFNGQCPLIVRKTAGKCQAESRADNKHVIFVEVKKQSQKETKAVKELKIGETFEYKGRKLKAIEKEGIDDCNGCVLFKEDCKRIHDLVGECEGKKRNDGKGVVFVDADEFDDCPLIEEGAQEETEEPKERKVGEVFEYEGRKLKVMEETDGCTGCYFREYSCHNHKIIGECLYSRRSNNKGVIFIDITDESANKPQMQEESQQKLNLCELLRYCPKGAQFWSPMLGDVKLNSIDHAQQRVYVILETGANWYLNSDATITFGSVRSADIMLYPSREQRDWSKVKYEPKHVLPRSWEEFCATHDITMSEYFIGETGNIFNSNSGKRIPDISKTILPSEQAAEAHLAYMQLHQLRNAWREGWTPDWKDNTQAKFAIVYNKYEYIVFDCRFISRFLTFQDESRAKEFLECFKDLIEKAGDLI